MSNNGSAEIRLSIGATRELGRHPSPEELARVHPLASRMAPYITWVFLRIGVSADNVTYTWGILGVAAAVLIGFGDSVSLVVGASLFGLSITLDLVDGQVARIRQSEGWVGWYLDRLFHHIVYPLLSAGMVVASYRAGSPAGVLLSGLVLTVSVGVFVVQADLLAHSLVKRGSAATSTGNEEHRSSLRNLVSKFVGPRPMVFLFVAASLVSVGFAGLTLADWVVVAFTVEFIVWSAVKSWRIVTSGSS